LLTWCSLQLSLVVVKNWLYMIFFLQILLTVFIIWYSTVLAVNVMF